VDLRKSCLLWRVQGSLVSGKRDRRARPVQSGWDAAGPTQDPRRVREERGEAGWLADAQRQRDDRVPRCQDAIRTMETCSAASKGSKGRAGLVLGVLVAGPNRRDRQGRPLSANHRDTARPDPLLGFSGARLPPVAS